MDRNRRAAMALMTLAAALPGIVAAQSYPVPNVTLVTHSSPGGGSDVFARTLIKYLQPKMGTNLVVENVSGGSGARAVAKVAQSPADGSIFYITTPTYIQTTLLSKPSHGYDSLMPVVNVFYDPEVLFVRKESPYKTLKDAIDDAKKGGKKWGAANPASLERIALERLKRSTQVNIAVVPHEGGRDMLLGVLNGTYDMGIGEIQELRSQLDAGQVRLIAVLTEKRLPDFPNLPTAKEQGFDLVVTKFRGLAGPKGLPPNILKAWNDGIRAVLADPAYQKEYAKESLIPAPMAADEAAKFTTSFVGDVNTSLKELGVVK